MPAALADPAQLLHGLAGLAPALGDTLVLAYERVVLPCHNMGCGDIVHRRWARALQCIAAALQHSRRLTGAQRAAPWTPCCGWSRRASTLRRWAPRSSR